MTWFPHDARRRQGCACVGSASGAQQGADRSGYGRLCCGPRGCSRAAAAALASTAGCAQQRDSPVKGQQRLRGREVHDGGGRGEASVTAAAAQWEHAAAGETWPSGLPSALSGLVEVPGCAYKDFTAYSSPQTGAANTATSHFLTMLSIWQQRSGLASSTRVPQPNTLLCSHAVGFRL